MPDIPHDLTLEDIARMAGVSPATASRVINNRVGLRSKARERVLEVVAETGFQPHAAARSLASQRSYVMGLLIPAPASTILTHPNVLQLAEVITQACQEHEYLLSLFLMGSDADERRILPKITRKGFIDGLIVRGADDRSSDPLLATLSATGMPLVSLGRPTDLPHVSYVAADNMTAAYHAVAHLLNLGRRRIGLLVGSLEPYASQERLAGYRKGLAERGLPVDEQFIAVGGMSESSGAAQRLLQQRPDALFMPTRMAPDVLSVLHAARLRVPDDIALVGFDDLPLAQQTDPPLTTVRQPMAAMGKQLVGMLLDIVAHGAHPPRHVVFAQELVIRQSCGALSLDDRWRTAAG
ncbi:MAG TPA: LacI family DNA-binding transcriptional regulator [Roseiflexaceae bacterium]|jgi:DNA-binding LacI/PurR family transcriptional regulator|nr:LacI family DNA-binding transcriptional regulator [Roseiflexaceae bacterium]